MERLSIEERREQYAWALNTLRLGQSGNRAALHAELLRQESALMDSSEIIKEGGNE